MIFDKLKIGTIYISIIVGFAFVGIFTIPIQEFDSTRSSFLTLFSATFGDFSFTIFS